MSNNNDAVIEFLLSQLRQQVNNNPYKQQCEDLAHEVLSLKNQLRDASALVAELHKEIDRLNVLNSELIFSEHEQSDCRKEDTQRCHHNWRFVNGKAPAVCINCGVTKSSECEHEWQFYGVGFPRMCLKCGLKSPGRQKEDAQECNHDWVLDEKGDYFVCAKCGKQEAELIDCQHTNTVGLRKGFAPGFTKKCLDCGAKLK